MYANKTVINQSKFVVFRTSAKSSQVLDVNIAFCAEFKTEGNFFLFVINPAATKQRPCAMLYAFVKESGGRGKQVVLKTHDALPKPTIK